MGLELKEKPALVAETLGPWGMAGVRVHKAGGETTEGDRVFKTEFDGHTYIVFKTNGGMDRYDMSGVVHDPDCKCFNK